LFPLHYFSFSFTDPHATEIYPLSLHDALPISLTNHPGLGSVRTGACEPCAIDCATAPQYASTSPANDPRCCRCRNNSRNVKPGLDRKSTRLNSSHVAISYAVFCLKKKTTASHK